MDEWVVWFYVEPFILHLDRDRGQHLLSPIVLVPVPVQVPDTDSVFTPLWRSLALCDIFFPVVRSVLTFTNITVWPLFVSVSVVKTGWRTVGHSLLRTILRVVQVEYITNITEQPWCRLMTTSAAKTHDDIRKVSLINFFCI